ncbi:MAG: helix-turn-helix domain-containing protein, partial [Chloroflexota bacterium]
MGLLSDPGRLPRRNHYQEGPDFPCVATQGGRPVTAVPRPAVAAIVRDRARALRRWAEGATVDEACARLGCSRATLFRWRERLEAGGIEGLLDRPRPGERSDLPPALEQAILLVRMLSYWNSRRIAAEFGRRDIAVSHGQVDRLLARSGTNRTSLTRVPGPRCRSPTAASNTSRRSGRSPTLLADLLAQAALGSRIVTGEILLAAEIAPPAWRQLRTRGGSLVPPGMPEAMAGWDKVPLESVVDGRPAGVTDGPG